MSSFFLSEIPGLVGSWFKPAVKRKRRLSLDGSLKCRSNGYTPGEEQLDGVPYRDQDLESQEKLSPLESTFSISSSSTLLEREDIKARDCRVDARVVSDAIIGLSDGLTVPFALTAGLSALGSRNTVIFGGLAELSAGAISMGLGGYLAARSEEESYQATKADTKATVAMDPATAIASVMSTFAPYDIPQSLLHDLTMHLSKSSKLPDFLLRFHHSLPEPASSRAFTCALTIAAGYFIGGFVPLLPYFFVESSEAGIMTALAWSIGIMFAALFAFGYCKTCFVQGWKGRENRWKGVKGGAQMALIGSFAAGVAMALVRGFNGLARE